VEADVSDAAQVEGMVQDALARFGRIDLLVNNAGSRPGWSSSRVRYRPSRPCAA
jgi:NAD(P)-dependent dehydrogenase (short-subunit alcohol dehydrogenase family)